MNFATSHLTLPHLASDQLQKLALCAVLCIGLKGVALAANSPERPLLTAPITSPAPEREAAPWIEPVRNWLEDEYDVPAHSIEPALIAAEEEGRPLGIDPLLIVAIIATESGFKTDAVSKMGAKGLMQIIPRFHQDKIGKQGKNALFDPQFNVRVGTRVLHEAMNRYGSTAKALQYYSGSLNDPSRGYTRKVLALKQRLRAVAATPAASPLG